MPTLTTMIEDNCPLIVYSADWVMGSSEDNFADEYSASSFTVTSKLGATATFTFNGTGVTLYGAKRGNHGSYQVRVDGNSYPPVNGQGGQFQVPLFQVSGLAQGEHVVILQNAQEAYLDLDFITWESNVGESKGKPLSVFTFQDTDPSFVYEPSVGAWSTNPSSLGSYFGGSGHFTSQPGSSFTYSFEGDGVSLYGPVGPNGAPYSVQVDNGKPTNYTTIKARNAPQMLLYHANNLGTGQHQVRVSYQPSSSGQVLAIDYANVYTTIGPLQQRRVWAAGPIVGITLGVIGVISIISAVLLYFRARQKFAKGASLEKLVDLSDESRPDGMMTLEEANQIIPRPFPLGTTVVPTREQKQRPSSIEHQVRVGEWPSGSQDQSNLSSEIGYPSATLVRGATTVNSTIRRDSLVPLSEGSSATRSKHPAGKGLLSISGSGTAAGEQGESSQETGPSVSAELLPPNYVQATRRPT